MTNRIILIFASLLAVLAGGYFFYQNNIASAAADEVVDFDSYATLNSSLDKLIDDFNAAAGSVRMIFVVGPSCGPCLRGLDDMNRVVGDMTRTNPNLKTFVLYVPTLRAEERHAARAIQLMKGKDISHYWDPNGQSGIALQKALGINAYAWDVWLIYNRDAEWTDSAPAPVHWEHQLGGLPIDQRLDPKRFAARVEQILAGENNYE